MEGRVDIGDMRRIVLRLLLPFFLLFLVSFVALEVTRRLLSPEYHEVLDWLQYIIGFLIAALLIYQLVKGYRSRMRVTPKEWILYEGRAIPLANLVTSGIFLLAALLLLVADAVIVPPMGFTDVGLMYLGASVFVFVAGLPAKLFVEKDGLVLKGGVSRLSMFVYIPFDELEFLTLKGRVFSYKEKKRLLRNRFLMQNSMGLAEALNRSWKILARHVSAMKMHYEGRAIRRGTIVLTGFMLFMSLMFLLGGFSLLPHRYLLGVPILAIGLIFLAFAVLYVRAGLQTRLSIVDDGLVIRQRPLPASTTSHIPLIVHIPFDSLSSLELRSKIFTYRGKEGFVRGWFIVQDSKRLASAIDRFWRRK